MSSCQNQDGDWPSQDPHRSSRKKQNSGGSREERGGEVGPTVCLKNLEAAGITQGPHFTERETEACRRGSSLWVERSEKGVIFPQKEDEFEHLAFWLARAVFNETRRCQMVQREQRSPGTFSPLCDRQAPWPWEIHFKEPKGSSPGLWAVQKSNRIKWCFRVSYTVTKCQGKGEEAHCSLKIEFFQWVF